MELLGLILFIAVSVLIICFILVITKISEMIKEIRRAVDRLVLHANQSNSPQKPIRKTKVCGDTQCPACGRLIFHHDPFCSHCGQKLDWSEDE
jgi:hypothetical protein